MRLLKRFALMIFAVVAFDAVQALAATISGGPVPLSVRTIEGRIHGTVISWQGDRHQLVVVNVAENVGGGQVADLFKTLSMQLARATAIGLSPSGSGGGCCATMTGSGIGFAGNVRAKLDIEQKVDGASRVVQTVTIRGYKGPPMDGYTAKLLFQ
jgi:hypothetical protein